MSQQATDLAVRRSIVVEAPQERAFTVFTERMSTWWPLETHHSSRKPRRRSSSRGQAGAGMSAPPTEPSASGDA